MTPRDPALRVAPSSTLVAPQRRPSRASREDAPSVAVFSGALIGPLLGAMLAIVLLGLLWAAPGLLLDSIVQGASWLRDHESTDARLGATIVIVALVALSFVAVWSRATSPNRPVRLPGGRGTIAVSQVAAWLSDALEARADIRQAVVRVERASGGIRVGARIAVTSDARQQETTEGACTIIERLVESSVGVTLTEPPSIDLRYEELVLRPHRAIDDLHD